MTPDDVTPLARFMRFRAAVFAAIGRALAVDNHCKAYEGALRVNFPSYFAGQGGGILYVPVDEFTIALDAYVIGPSRHYSWSGETLDAALDKAEADLAEWVKEIEEEEAES